LIVAPKAQAAPEAPLQADTRLQADAPVELWSGVLCGVLAGMLWGLVFVAPLVLPDYGALALALGRYLAFGVIATVLALRWRSELGKLDAVDWWEALRLAAVGNLLYYILLAGAIQYSGGPLATLIIATLPLVIPVCATLAGVERGSSHKMGRLFWPALAVAAGLILVYREEGARLALELTANDAYDRHNRHSMRDAAALLKGALLGLGALACWTWYPIRNALWLHRRPQLAPRDWATAQGLATFVLSALGLLGVVVWQWLHAPADKPFAWQDLLGPRPLPYIASMLALGLLASWMGTWLWNRASTRLPVRFAGMLIVFETVFALLYVYAWRGEMPDLSSLAGISLLAGGVLWGLRQVSRP